MSGHEPPVLVEREGALLVITLNRPHVRNAINMEVAETIEALMDRFDDTSSERVAILTGAGTTFCAGMDLKSFVDGVDPTTDRRGFAGLTRIPPRKPIIAAVEGHALAGGFEIVLACDLIVAASDATFALTEVRRGLVAQAGGLLRLPARIPYHLAMEFALTGERLSALRAAELGLVNRVVEPGSALVEARALAATILSNAPLAVAGSKQIIVESDDWARSQSFERQRAIAGPIFASDDAAEGAVAFIEKRSPVWRGR
jgi:enoyl-CoA hydratase